ncbi:MAG: ferredoxin thioredoxin reductase catalytic beta chain [Spirochaetia bacterium]|nr:ferredoxin thioredoxin reductase catalytic beta chain [Spirochaetia bacterium]
MKGFRLNPDKDYVAQIIAGIQHKNGHCPCRLKTDDTTLCPCDEFISSGICKCHLFLKEDELLKKS